MIYVIRNLTSGRLLDDASGRPYRYCSRNVAMQLADKLTRETDCEWDIDVLLTDDETRAALAESREFTRQAKESYSCGWEEHA